MQIFVICKLSLSVIVLRHNTTNADTESQKSFPPHKPVGRACKDERALGKIEELRILCFCCFFPAYQPTS
ncbi:hypothetical protein VNO77_28961 [Canavalia gladiata]|uniref:Secreted protein n=1 Tax=Canavalia gladiata TaxID=3824 RepID=A0AAN9KYV6_CANGL